MPYSQRSTQPRKRALVERATDGGRHSQGVPASARHHCDRPATDASAPVGRTPWSARVPLDPLPAQPNQPHRSPRGKTGAAGAIPNPAASVASPAASVAGAALMRLVACSAETPKYSTNFSTRALLIPRLRFTRSETWAREPGAGTRSACLNPRASQPCLPY
jgi:hypothetical protein